MLNVIAMEQVLGMQINRWRGESTAVDSHVNVVPAILPAIYMRRPVVSCLAVGLVSLVYYQLTAHLSTIVSLSLDLINGSFSARDGTVTSMRPCLGADQQSSSSSPPSMMKPMY